MSADTEFAKLLEQARNTSVSMDKLIERAQALFPNEPAYLLAEELGIARAGAESFGIER